MKNLRLLPMPGKDGKVKTLAQASKLHPLALRSRLREASGNYAKCQDRTARSARRANRTNKNHFFPAGFFDKYYRQHLFSLHQSNPADYPFQSLQGERKQQTAKNSLKNYVTDLKSCTILFDCSFNLFKNTDCNFYRFLTPFSPAL